MLSEDERREMQEMARSQMIREEFERLRAASRPHPSQPFDLDRLLNFLTTMSRFSTVPPAPRPFHPYARVLL